MAVALTKDQWLRKLESWVPRWFTDQGPIATAILDGLAEMLSEGGQEVDWMIAQTKILGADDPYLSTLGDERSVYQRAGETEDAFRLRIQSSATTSYCPLPQILALVQALAGTSAWVRPDYSAGLFPDEGCFMNRRDVTIDAIKDGFTIFVDQQTSLQALQLISDSVQAVKAFGTVFHLIERVS